MQKLRSGSRACGHGVTLLEVLIAVFILMVGIIGILSAIPTGIVSAENVIFLDASIHLAHSKFDEFARDRVDPAVDLQGGGYLDTRHGPINSSHGGIWRDFAHKHVDQDNGDPYEYFDDINRYEWCVLVTPVGAAHSGTPAPVGGVLAPVHGGGNGIKLWRVTVVTHLRGTTREHRFTQYMLAPGY